MSSQELAKTTALTPVDSWDMDDGDDSMGGALFVKFDAANPPHHFDRGGDPVPTKPWLGMGCQKEAVCWGRDKKIVDRIIQQPGGPPIDVESLNAKIPVKDWPTNPFGPPKGPWEMQYQVFMVSPEDGSKIISSNSTFGQKAAYRDLKDRIQFMRLYRGDRVVPIIELSSKLMKTRFGSKLRPHFEIIGWKNFGPTAPPVPEITAPSAGEIIADEIADHPAPEMMPWDDQLPEM